jgi:hypothetical protein
LRLDLSSYHMPTEANSFIHVNRSQTLNYFMRREKAYPLHQVSIPTLVRVNDFAQGLKGRVDGIGRTFWGNTKDLLHLMNLS